MPGHWGRNLSLGRGLTQVATLIERSRFYRLLVKLGGHDMRSVSQGVKREVMRLPEELRESLTWDRGMELANQKQVSVDTRLKEYFADPHCCWQRASKENINGLLCQYFPKAPVQNASVRTSSMR